MTENEPTKPTTHIPGTPLKDGARRFTSQEVEDLVWDDIEGCREVEREYGDNDRWTRNATSIILLPDGGHYRVAWSEALTESQENEYWEQDAEPVRPVTLVHAEITTEYLTAEEESDADDTKAMTAYASLLTDEGRATILDALGNLPGIDTDKYARFDWGPQAKPLREAAAKYFAMLGKLAETIRDVDKPEE